MGVSFSESGSGVADERLEFADEVIEPFVQMGDRELRRTVGAE
jgi:hypothetical protein